MLIYHRYLHFCIFIISFFFCSDNYGNSKCFSQKKLLGEVSGYFEKSHKYEHFLLWVRSAVTANDCFVWLGRVLPIRQFLRHVQLIHICLASLFETLQICQFLRNSFYHQAIRNRWSAHKFKCGSCSWNIRQFLFVKGTLQKVFLSRHQTSGNFWQNKYSPRFYFALEKLCKLR